MEAFGVRLLQMDDTTIWDRQAGSAKRMKGRGLWPSPVLKKVRLSEPRIIPIRIGSDEEGVRQTDRSLHYSCSFPISAACSSIKAAIYVLHQCTVVLCTSCSLSTASSELKRRRNNHSPPSQSPAACPCVKVVIYPPRVHLNPTTLAAFCPSSPIPSLELLRQMPRRHSTAWASATVFSTPYKYSTCGCVLSHLFASPPPSAGLC